MPELAAEAVRSGQPKAIQNEKRGKENTVS